LIIKRKQDSDDLSVLLLSKLFNACCFAADDVRVCTWKIYSLQQYVKINNHDIQVK